MRLRLVQHPHLSSNHNLSSTHLVFRQRCLLSYVESLSTQELQSTARSSVESYFLSPMQEGMLFHSLHQPSAGFDIEQLVCSLPEHIESTALKWAAEQVVNRHAVFRTSFKWLLVREPIQVVEATADVTFVSDDLSGFPPMVQTEQVERYLEDDRRKGFAMDRAPLTRFALFRLAEQHYKLIWTFHHALLDGRSFVTILNELFALYEARRESRELHLPPPIPYGGYIEWLKRRDPALSEGYWRETLKGFRQATPLVALDGAGVESGHGEEEIRLPEAITDALRKIAAREEVTLNTVVQGAWALLLGRYSNSDDVVCGVTRACRGTFPDAASIVGVFINTLPLRVSIRSGVSLFPWLRQIRTSQLSVRDHELTPLISIQGWSDVARGTPLFESIIVFDNYLLNSRMQAQGGPWAKREVHLRERTNFPLTLYGYGEAELILRLSYDKKRFSFASIRRTLGHLRTVLTAVAGDLNQPITELPLLTEQEQRQILLDWNETSLDYSREKRIHDLFEDQAQRTPEALSVIFRDHHLTYRELSTRANQLARHLEQAGVKPGDRVAICLRRSHKLLVALMATLKAGCAYVPLDPPYPMARIEYVLSDANVAVVITEEGLRDRIGASGAPMISIDTDASIIERHSGDQLSRVFPSETLAYLIYTSGSTGKPKGVMVSHRNVGNFFAAMDRTIGEAGPGVWLAVTSISFDISVLELFWTLAHGFRLVVQEETSDLVAPDASIAGAGYSIPEQISKHRVTHLQCTPSLARMLLDLPGGRSAIGSLRMLLVGGEALAPSIAEELCNTGVGQIFNMYGPTETTIWSTMDRIRGADVTIGRPIANTSVFVLDGDNHPVPVGVPGELYIGGEGVTQGYWNRPELTNERFIQLPFPNHQRVYRTGDLVKYFPDGRLDFLGRVDQQVKIRGHRIELSEIEAVLGEHPYVRGSIVTSADDRHGGKLLVAHIVGRDGSPVSQTDLRQFLSERLPAYMVPGAYAFHDVFPLTPNGKIDRGALASSPINESVTAEAFSAPNGEIERRLAAIWEDVLNTRPIGTRDNFFQLGGHSLLITHLGNRIEQEFGRRLSMADVFQTPTIEGMAALLRKAGVLGSECRVFSLQPGSSRPPFICLGAGPFFLPLAQAIGEDQPFCGVDLNSLRASHLTSPYQLEEIAGHVKKAIRKFQPGGPYFLGGWCLFGVLMYETARQMLAEGDEVALLVMIDSPNLAYEKSLTPLGRLNSRMHKLAFHLRELAQTQARKIPEFVKHQIRIGRNEMRVRRDQNRANLHKLSSDPGYDFERAFQIASRCYNPPSYSGRVMMLQTTERPSSLHWDLGNRWRHLITQMEVIDVPAGHAEMFQDPHVRVLAKHMKARLTQPGLENSSL